MTLDELRVLIDRYGADATLADVEAAERRRLHREALDRLAAGLLRRDAEAGVMSKTGDP